MPVENFPFLSVFRVRSSSSIIQDMPKTKNIWNYENQNKNLGRCTEKKIKEAANCHYLDTDTSLELELQSDHVHFFHCAKLIELWDLFGHLINGHFDGVQLCAGLAYDLNPLLHVGKQVTGYKRERNGSENSPNKRVFRKAEQLNQSINFWLCQSLY